MTAPQRTAPSAGAPTTALGVQRLCTSRRASGA
jgi:hypothetical protein